jgi:hypothetical protein
MTRDIVTLPGTSALTGAWVEWVCTWPWQEMEGISAESSDQVPPETNGTDKTQGIHAAEDSVQAAET